MPKIRAKTREEVEIVSHQKVYDGYFSIEKYLLKHQLFQGGWSQVMSREIFERGHAAAVLPYDPERKKVVLSEQFRPGALEDTKSPWLIEVVAGIIEPGETPNAVAMREAHEEAGLTIEKLMPITHYWVSPGGTTESVHLFCGKVDSEKANGIHGLDGEDEDIRVLV